MGRVSASPASGHRGLRPVVAAIALLTIYDMCKAVDLGMTISGERLMEKHGGKSGSFVAARAKWDTGCLRPGASSMAVSQS